jgi:hypothetical protein
VADAQTQTTKREELREKIIAMMHDLVLPKKIEVEPQPTIDQLEKILNSVDPPSISLQPDGSVVEYRPQTTTVQAVADGILDLLEVEGVMP